MDSLRKRTVSYGINALPKRVYRFWPGPHLRVGLAEARKDAFEGNNPSDVLENNITIICKHYSIGCISQRDALLPSAARLSVEEVAGDCLHPVHGSRVPSSLSTSRALADAHDAISEGGPVTLLPPALP